MKIDLRSDTVTTPSDAMRAAMAAAPVGDDQYGEDPSVNQLQEQAAELLGKEAGLFLPSGTMANQVALRVLTRHGDDVVVGEESHVSFHETGAAAAISGVQFTEVGKGGTFTAADLLAAIQQRNHASVRPPTSLVIVENTHNRGGGLLFSRAESEAIAAVARGKGLATYLDGARLFNAATALGETARDLAAPYELVAISLSKGLGAPVGSILAGTRAAINEATRYRRMLGGAMRQAGVIAAAGIVALRDNIGRLGDDHDNARLIATRLASVPGVTVDPAAVLTNIVLLRLGEGLDAFDIVERCKAEGVLALPFSRSTVRLTTHLQVSRADCEAAAAILARVLGEAPRLAANLS